MLIHLSETEELGSNKLCQNITISSKKKVKKITEAEGSLSQNKNAKNLLSEIHFAGNVSVLSNKKSFQSYNLYF